MSKYKTLSKFNNRYKVKVLVLNIPDTQEVCESVYITKIWITVDDLTNDNP